MEDTISAIATALGEGAIGIIRLSGEESLNIAQSMFVPSGRLSKGKPRQLVYGWIQDKQKVIDEVLCVYMPAPHSYTGEDVVEIQCHGGLTALKTILSLTYRAGARPAEPGEFTKRAFLNGRMDLVQAEAVMDVIEARGKEALMVASQQQKGQLSAAVRSMRKQLLDVVVQLEAVIDYPEEDIPEVTYSEAAASIAQALRGLEDILSHCRVGRIMREGLRTVISGRPNVGKSSLLNSLLREERAIVSEIPGTTRDVISEQLLVEGIPLVLTDTAGIHASGDYVEQVGVRKARQLMEEAELIIAVVDLSLPLQAEDEEILALLAGREYVVIANKVDLPAQTDIALLQARFGEDRVVPLSAKTTEGVAALLAWLKTFVYGRGGSIEKGIFVQRARQKELLEQARTILQEALSAAQSCIPYDCVIIDVRQALEKLGEITGESVSGEIIDEIFKKFCIGK